MKKLILSALIITGCGQAPQSEAEKSILPHEHRQTISTTIELKNKAREIIILAFPNRSEVVNYSYERPDFENVPDYDHLFDLLPFGHHYKQDIPKDASPELKIQSLIGKVIAISDARDQARRNIFELWHPNLELTRKLLQEANIGLFDKYSCYRVSDKRNPNFGKCYINPLPKVTEVTPKKLVLDNCQDIDDNLQLFLSMDLDKNIARGEEENYFIKEAQISHFFSTEWKNHLQTCIDFEEQISEEVQKNQDLIDYAKMEVSLLLTSVSNKLNLVFGAGSESFNFGENYPNENLIVFNAQQLSFEKFIVTLDFKDQGEKNPKVFSPELGNMTSPLVTRINDSDFYKVDFKIFAEEFTLETQGLSMSLDETLGLRISGKTRLIYNNGLIRQGIIRIDISPEIYPKQTITED